MPHVACSRSRKNSKATCAEAVLIVDWHALTQNGRSVPDHGEFAAMLATLRLRRSQVVIIARADCLDARAWVGTHYCLVESTANNAMHDEINAAVEERRTRRLFLSVPARARDAFTDLIDKLKARGIAVGVISPEVSSIWSSTIRKLSSSVTLVPGLFPLPPRINTNPLQLPAVASAR